MSDTIATLLTGRGRGAVATIAIEGGDAESLIRKHFESTRSAKSNFLVNRIYFGTWRWQDYAEELVICRTNPLLFEIHCHGGKLAAQNILQSLVASGAVSVEPNERLTESNPFVVEAQNQLPLVKTEKAVSILLDQTRGAMEKALTEIRAQMESDPVGSIQRLETIRSYASLGATLTHPFSVILIGPPNAGKSSLVNAIVGFERAIVYDQPGTTRDVVSAETALDGWAISLSDTAGIRQSEDPVERAGIEIAKQKSATADLLLLITDLSSDSNVDLDIDVPDDGRSITVGTKSDLVSKPCELGERPLDVITSSTTGQGIETLCERIVTELVPQLPAAGAAVPISQWQVEQVDALLSMLRQQAIEDASLFLSKLLG